MKIKYKSFCFLVISSIILFNIEIFSQIKPEFILSDSAFVGDMVIDDDNNLHIVLDRREDIIYRKYDSAFNPVSDFKSFHNTPMASDSKIAIRNNYMVTVWRDFSLIMFYNSEIVGNISNITETELNPDNFFVNQEYYDAKRGTPDICFIDDTTFFVIWAGNGPYTVSTSGIYGRIFSISGEPLTPDLLIIDRYNDTSRAILPKILHSKKSNNLIATWVSNYDNNYKLWGRLFHSDGTPLDSSFIISDDPLMTDMYDYDIAVDAEENFAAAWAAGKDSVWELQWRWYNPYWEPFTSSKTISSSKDSVVSYSSINIGLSKDGKAVLGWNNGNETISKRYIKRFSSDWNQIGNSFRISENDSTYEGNAILLLKSNEIFSAWSVIGYGLQWFGTLGKILDFNNPTEAEDKTTVIPILLIFCRIIQIHLILLLQLNITYPRLYL